MLKFISTVLLGLIAALIAAFFQNRTWRNRNIVEIGQRELKDVVSVIENLSTAIDQRLVAQRHFASLVASQSVGTQDLEKYRAALDTWMGQFNSFKSKIFLYFGRQEMIEFEEVVHRNLRETSEIVLRTHRLGIENLSRGDLDEYRAIRKTVDYAQYIAYRFLNRLNDRASNMEFGTIQFVNNLEVADLDMISRSYLLLRLFGMKS